MTAAWDAGLARHWRLDPDVTFLNHGSFGACPTPVLEAQRAWQDRLEREPVRFFVRDYQAALDGAREALATLVGADPADLAFVPNATAGVSTVLRSLDLRPGDEVLVTDHGYRACRNAVDFVTARAGARTVVARLPFPLEGPDAAVEAVLSAVTPRTRLAVVDHVTSPTALVLPIDRIVRELAGRGVDALVDAAHAPGHVPMDLRAVGAAYATGNCHKWLCTPKGCAFLHVRRDRQASVRPLAISHGASLPLAGRSRFQVELDWTGTWDPSPALVVPDALRFLGGLAPGGLPALQARNHALAVAARDALCGVLGVAPPCPAGMLAAMASVPLPCGLPPDAPEALDPLQEALWARHRIEVPVIPWPALSARLLRVSAFAYTTPADVGRLVDALPALLR